MKRRSTAAEPTGNILQHSSPLYLLGAAVLLLLFLIRVTAVLQVQSSTYDEVTCLNTARYLCERLSWDIKETVQHPPLSYFWYGFLVKHAAPSAHFDEQLRIARYAMLVFPLLLGYFIFQWGKTLWGPKAGLVALGLFTFSPNVIAHSGLLTQDILVATFMFLALYSFEGLLAAPSARTTAAAGLALGLALLSKYTAVFLFPLYVVRVMAEPVLKRPPFGIPFSGKEIRSLLKKILLVMIIGIALLNLGYFFTGTGTSFNGYSLKSGFSLALSRIPFISHVPLPLPSPYLYGFDIQKYVAELGHPSYLLGQTGVQGWWYYFIVAYLIKVPLPFLLLLGASIILLPYETKKKAVLLIPVACFCLPFLLLTQSNPGLRYLLPVFPFLFLFVSWLVTVRNKTFTVIFFLFLGWYAVESFRIHPHYLAYFNQLIGGPENGYKYLADSNIDWGQDQKLVTRYLEKCARERKSVTVNPLWPSDGDILVNVNNITDIFRLRKKYDWLMQFQPVDTIGYDWLLFSLNVRPPKEGSFDTPLMNYTAGWIMSREHGDTAAGKQLAETALQQLEKQPSNRENSILAARCFYLLGLIAGQHQDTRATDAYFRKSIEAYPYFHEAYDALAQLAAYKGDTQAAHTLKRFGTGWKILESYAVHLSTDTQEYERRIASDPLDHVAYNNLGFLLWMQGNTEKAIHTLERAVLLQPSFSGTYGTLASCYYEKGDWKKTAEHLNNFFVTLFKIDSSVTQTVVFGEDRIILDPVLVIPPEEVIPPEKLSSYRQSTNK